MKLTNTLRHLITENVNINQDLINSITKSKEFKDWFKYSEMVNGKGEPMIFFHGSPNKFDKFDKSMIGASTDAGFLGRGFYFYTDITQAWQYGKVTAYFLNITSPYFATYEEFDRLSELNDVEVSEEFTEHVKSEGCDGVYYNDDLRGETVVFEPNQIWKICEV